MRRPVPPAKTRGGGKRTLAANKNVRLGAANEEAGFQVPGSSWTWKSVTYFKLEVPLEEPTQKRAAQREVDKRAGFGETGTVSRVSVALGDEVIRTQRLR
ncbi:hypothetical protein SKAU_G00314220 [Synaphobranchus kaupii]|uniref:Uncharacterized protein n=1 Tax=Synaphobranchus kaupii TaxID=118154 RepID=A0A9Q1ES89_SYNKA|nr:hypothetical protein SKAU_G00314220 [Synaphobranchus kaupii]